MLLSQCTAHVQRPYVMPICSEINHNDPAKEVEFLEEVAGVPFVIQVRGGPDATAWGGPDATAWV